MTLKEKEKLVLSKEKYWHKEKDLLEREYILKAEKKALKEKYKEKRDKIANSKFLIWFLFTNCTIIELFTLFVIVQEFKYTELGLIMNLDLQPLIALISTVVAEVIGFSVYSLKSAKENTAGGIVYETAMMKLGKENYDEEMSECECNEDGSYG